MIIGVPKEIKEQEYRVAMLPAGAWQLVKHHHRVLVEKDAAAGIGYCDDDYRRAGAEIVECHEQIFAEADVIAKVHCGGKGVLLGGVPGVLPGRVVVLGGGTAGVNAARMASGLGADVTILEVDLERMRYLDITIPASTLYSSESSLVDILPATDLLIGAVLVPGAKAPKLVHRSMLRLMKPGSVFVDIAIDQGGCAETSRPTTHLDPVYEEEGVIHYCVANMPGAYARTATLALTNATFPYFENLADLGLEEACRKQPALASGVTVWNGKIVNKAVAEAHGLPYEPFGSGEPKPV